MRSGVSLAMATIDKSKYYLYIDECGDNQLEKFNPNFPIFTLCGVLVPGDKLDSLEFAVNEFIREIFADKKMHTLYCNIPKSGSDFMKE